MRRARRIQPIFMVLGTAGALLVPSLLIAGTVSLDVSDIAENQPISAADMLQRFQQLQAAINDNDSRIAALESKRVKATQLFDSEPGPLPLVSPSFSTSGGTLIIMVSGAGYPPGNNAYVGMTVTLDGNVVGESKGNENVSGYSMTFPSRAFVVSNVEAGNHSLVLSASFSTVTVAAHAFNATVIELDD